MSKTELIQVWKSVLMELTGVSFPDSVLETLALQTIDSIKRIEIYKIYKLRAIQAEENSLSYYHTHIPFVLCQRESLPIEDKIWFLYLATYFGKSNKSKWKLFKRAAFDTNNELIRVETILKHREQYFENLQKLDFFQGSNFSNHRKFTAKRLVGENGFFASADYFLDNLSSFIYDQPNNFDDTYKASLKIPGYGRMAAFDFTATLCKCDCKVLEPISMYHSNSTGPLTALELILRLSGKEKPINKKIIVQFGNELLKWFLNNTDIFMIAQVLEDAICNWQKSPRKYRRYFG